MIRQVKNQLAITVAGIFLVAGVMLAPMPALAQIQPDEMVKSVSEDVLDILRKNNDVYQKDRKKLFTMVDEKVLPYFDFRKMSQLVLGLNWRNASDDQKDRFTVEFKELLVRTYAVVLLKFTDQKLVYLPYRGKPTDKTVLVKVVLKQTGGSADIPFEYRFYNSKKNGWKVIDLTVEGVSMVTNYRKVYAEKIKTEGMDALIASIAKANKESRNK